MASEEQGSPLYICPYCRGGLGREPGLLLCVACAAAYPVEDGIADFSRGAYYDSFDPTQPELPAEHLLALEDEETGTRARIEEFYLPRLRSLAAVGAGRERLRVLDCGCGSGLSVDLLEGAGFAAWGNDLSLLRRWQWRERSNRHRLLVVDGSTLPFPDGFFDVVICSGVLEHVGVRESGGMRYAVAPLPDKESLRRRFIAELLRVTNGAGRIWLDFPNGAFPIDFWHGTFTRGMRWHSLREGFLPTVGEIRRHVRSLGHRHRVVRGLSPHGRLHFRRARRHWYGRALEAPMRALLFSMRLPVVRRFAASPVNPYLVVEIAPGAIRPRRGRRARPAGCGGGS